MADLNLTVQAVAGKVPELRAAFETKFADSIKSGTFDARDVTRLRTDDAYARCFLRTLKSKGDIAKSLDVINESLKFRQDIGINDLVASTFPAEMTDLKAIYYKGKDVQGHPILYINVKENVTKSDQVPLLKQYIAWHFDQHQKTDPEQMCVVLMDMSGASTGNMSMDITKYIITCFTSFFPSFLAYMINYDMPMLLSATWTIISAFLSTEQKKKLLVIKKGDIKKYVPEEHLWPHMK